MAAAYAPFANGGTYYAPRLITRVTEGGKTILTVNKSGGQRVWDQQTAFLGLDMIRGVVNDLTPYQGGLGWKARIDGREVGGKTGTTNAIRDLWFAGVTPGLSGAVWVGRSDNAPLPASAYSGDVAAPVWQAAAAGALRGQQVAVFSAPPDIDFRRVRGVQMAFKVEQSGGFLGGLFGGNAAPAQNNSGQDTSARDQQAAQNQTSQQAADQAAADQAVADQAAQAQADAQAAADAAQQAAQDQAAQDAAAAQAAADQAARDQAAAQAAQDQAAQDQAARDQAAQQQNQPPVSPGGQPQTDPNAVPVPGTGGATQAVPGDLQPLPEPTPSTTPTNSVPASPDNTVPGGTVPDNTVPNSTVPGAEVDQPGQ